MIKHKREKTVTEKAFANRDDNYIIKTKERITKSLFGITLFTRENFENLESIDVTKKEQEEVISKGKIGFNVGSK
jgi:predicted ATP-grasp superfamily ATP-dependent carboligase